MRRPLLIALFLAAVTIAVYWPVLGHKFINYDDPAYVTDNPRVQAGLTQAGVIWAFTQLHGERTYWHPVTWLSHMLDCQLFGLNAGAHHLVNLLFHAANVMLLFGVLWRLTGAIGRSAIVAGLFALHPLQVDTVAWVTERKNVLSTFFFLLAVWAYGRYAQKSEGKSPQPESGTRESAIKPPASRLGLPISGHYWLAVLWFGLGLLSKPVVVTLPCVLLLLDYWPLQRWPRCSVSRLLIEKVPFLVLAAAASTIMIVANQQMGIVTSLEQLPLAGRLANALVSYARYLKKVFWPQDLAVFYPYPAAWPMEVVILAAVVLLGISVLVVWRRRSQPYLAVGWCWFVGTLVPTIGLIQAGDQSMADRFAYVPLMGLGLMLVWGGSSLMTAAGYRQVTSWMLSSMLLVAFGMTTRQQLRYWQDSTTLFQHALAVTQDNFVADNNLGNALYRQGRRDEAIAHFRKALQVHPVIPDAQNNLGLALFESGRVDEAIAHFLEALRLQPGDAEVHNNLGYVLLTNGRMVEAIPHLRRAAELRPNDARVHHNFGMALLQQGSLADATTHFRMALEIQPDHADAHASLGLALFQGGRMEEAIGHFQQSLRILPGDAIVHNNLGYALLKSGRVDEAISHFEKALALRPDYSQARKNLDLALRPENPARPPNTR